MPLSVHPVIVRKTSVVSLPWEDGHAAILRPPALLAR